MSRAASKLDPAQEELPLSSVRPHAAFPGRTSLYLGEVARHLQITERQLIDLIEEYEATGGASGIKGFSIANAVRSAAYPQGNKTARNAWRIAVSDLDAFIQRKAASHLRSDA